MGTFLCENSTCSPFSAELSHFSSPQSSDGAETRMGGATDSPLSSYRRRTVSTFLIKHREYIKKFQSRSIEENINFDARNLPTSDSTVPNSQSEGNTLRSSPARSIKTDAFSSSIWTPKTCAKIVSTLFN